MSANGRLKASELSPVGNGMYLLTATANAWARMSAACKAATGVTMRITPPYGAYRDWAAQQYMVDHPQGPVRIAPPGSSTHGDGRAVDVSNFSLVLGWLTAHAREFGFARQFAAEPWHWKHDGTTAAGSGTPISTESENIMRAIREPSGGITLVGETTYQNLTLAQWMTEAKIWGGYTQLSLADYQTAITDTQVRRAYLLAGIGGGVVDAAAIATKVTANVKADLAKLSTEIAAINTAVGVPTAEEIADAVWVDAAARLKS